MPGCEGGCKWNNKLAHETFEENSEKFGKEKALQLLRDEVQSWVRERDGRKFDWSVRMKDNHLVSETNGKSITGMIEDSMNGTHSNTVSSQVKENAPLELAIAQEVTSLAAGGAQRIIAPEPYRTESGDTIVRYFTILTRDKDDTTLYHGDRIDLGKNVAFGEVQTKLNGLAQFHQSIVHDRAFALAENPHGSLEKQEIISTVIKDMVNSGKQIMHEVKITGSAIIDYIDRQKNKGKAEDNMQIPLGCPREFSATGLFTEIFSQKEENKVLQDLINEGIDKEILKSMTEEEVVALWLHRAEEVMGINSKQSRELLNKVEEAWETVRGAQEVINFVVHPETEMVAIPAALFVLQVLAHPEMFLQEQDGTHEEEFVVVFTQQERDAIFASFNSTDEEIILEHSISTESVSGLQNVDTTALIWTREVIQFIDQLSPEEAIKIVDHKKEVVLVHMSELLEVFQELFGQKTIEEGEKKKPVEQFTFAYAFWLLLKLDSYYRSLNTLKDFIVLGGQKTDNMPLNLLARLKVQMPEGLVRKEVGAFILAAIIWHLAQKREAGMYQSPNPKKIVKKKYRMYIKSFVRPLPQAGILFAF